MRKAFVYFAAFFASALHLGAALHTTDLRCEYLKEPLGIDTTQPRLSWVLEGSSHAHGQRQTAYEILVASDPELLKHDNADLWHAGPVDSDQSIHIKYNGKPLGSEQQCFWKVRVWDEHGKKSGWSDTAKWTMGLLKPSDWKGQWIGQDGTEKKASIEGTSWIWFPEGKPAASAPIGKRYFRKTIDIRGDNNVRAKLLATADNSFTAYVNGKTVSNGGNFKAFTSADVEFHPGKNVIAIMADNSGNEPNPAGLVALVKVEGANRFNIPTDESWKASDHEIDGWQQAGFDDSSWPAAKKLGSIGMGPWGEIGAPEDRQLAARYLRKRFLAGGVVHETLLHDDKPERVAFNRKIQRATIYMSGLGLSELYLNGKKVGNAVLSPGLTEYDKRDFYVTYDVTSQIKYGENALGVILGNGRFFAPRLKVPTTTHTFGYPKLMFQLRIEYDHGPSDEIVSDDTWKLTTNGPIRANNEYDGEEYDARLETTGWSEPHFNDSQWQHAEIVSAPGGTLEAEMTPPLRVTGVVKPIAMKNPSPGVYIYDMGQNMVGWCKLKVSGPRGTAVSMRHAETLHSDGTLYVDNLRSARVTDTYILKGNGKETYEPRFTYHGFRYVELTGFPGKPDLSTIEGHLVNDDLEPAGEFACSNPLINRIYKNVAWGVRGNYRSMPTDCPQRDERQGWLGDRAFESKGETYIFNTATLHAKWLRDMADTQKENGSVSDVCPSYWPLYSDNVSWPSATVIMPDMLHEQFGDKGIIASHYDSMKKWMDHMATFIKDDLIAKDSYGDWCVPPEEQHLIHSNDPKRKTNPTLLATSYFYNDLRLMERYATLLGKIDDAKVFGTAADRMKTAFNAKFLNHELGQYDNGTQTSCVLPLAFGLVPDDQHARVFHHLVKNLTEVTQNHVGTGLVGGQWLNRVLMDNGRPDLVYAIATQTNYPSWGYMVEHGATTIWELWNGNTADPAMNSGNHVMLVGDLVVALYENVAGIKADPQSPGFQHIIMHPQPVTDLKSARATHRSPYGLIVSDWKQGTDKFVWNVTVPPNSVATVYIPASDEKNVSGLPKDGCRVVGVKDGALVCEIGSGHYKFESKTGRGK